LTQKDSGCKKVLKKKEGLKEDGKRIKVAQKKDEKA